MNEKKRAPTAQDKAVVASCYEYAIARTPTDTWVTRFEGPVDKCIKKAKREVGYRKRRVVRTDGVVVVEWNWDGKRVTG